VEREVRRVFEEQGVASRGWISPLGCPGARVIQPPGESA
jgi:hypothetical protein